MKKFLLLTSLATLVIITILIGCSKSQKSEGSSLVETTEEAKNEIQSKNLQVDLQKLFDLRNETAEKVIGNGISRKMLIKAIETQNLNEIKKSSQISNQELNEYSTKLLQLKEEILQKYPEVRNQYNKEKECKNCNTEKSIAYLDKIVDRTSINQDMITQKSVFENGSKMQQVVTSAAGCRWAAVTACLLVCTSVGPWLYWLCSGLCYDSYCSQA